MEKHLEELMTRLIGAVESDSLGSSWFTVYYSTPEQFSFNDDLAMRAYKEGTASVNLSNYIKLTDIRARDLEEVFYMMQGDIWSPMGEARSIITAKRLAHTSMSVGDLVGDAAGDFYICAITGFVKVVVIGRS